jgi:hypothetical protein
MTGCRQNHKLPAKSTGKEWHHESRTAPAASSRR